MAWWDRFTRQRGAHEAPTAERAAIGSSWFSTFPTGNREAIGSSFPSYVTDGYQANGVVFAVVNARLTLLAQAEFKWQDLATKRLFGTPDLMLLERPWPNGTTGDLLSRMLQDVDLAGNAYVRRATQDMLERLRPDLVDIVSAEHFSGAREVVGYAYWRNGRGSGNDPDYYPVADVAHWAPIPDPMANFRGMSWLTPVVREVDGDALMTDHRLAFFRNSATPNMLVRVPNKLSTESAERLSAQVNARHGGAMNAWRTMVVDEGTDVTMIGSTFDKMAFTAVQAAGEVRIAIAAGVPPQVVGMQAGLDAGTFANYDQAFKSFASTTMAYLWQSLASALAPLVSAPADTRLWYSTQDIPALQDAETARAEASATNAGALSTLIQAGYRPDVAMAAVVSGDLSLLSGGHTGLVSVQMQTPGSQSAPAPVRSAPDGDRSVHITNMIPAAPVAEPSVVNLTVNEREAAVQPQPIVNVAAPAVTVEVNPTPVTVDVAAPNVSVTNDVQPSPVAVENLVSVSTPPRKVTTEVQRDPRGLITKTTATERDA